jgi:hypothetical protein
MAWAKPRKTSIRIAGIRIQIWTRDLPDTKQDVKLSTVMFDELSEVAQYYLYKKLFWRKNNCSVSSDSKEEAMLNRYEWKLN